MGTAEPPLRVFHPTVLAKILFMGVVLSICAFLSQDRLVFRELFSQSKRAEVPADKSFHFQTVSLAQAIHTFHTPGAVILDVRARRYYDYGHIEGALNLIPEAIPKLAHGDLQKLRKAPVVLVYCNSTDCGGSYFAARMLMEKGLDNVQVYPEGWGEWRSCRLAMTMSKEMARDVANERSHEK